jgi:fatty acid desaturase
MRAVSRDFIAKNVKASDIKPLYKKCLWRWIWDASRDWCVIAATIAAASWWNNPAGYILAVLIVGNRQHALSCLGHDGAHFTISRNRNLNEFLANIMAWFPVGLTNSGYRNMHNMHHLHLNTAHDPEINHKGMRAPQWDLPATPLTILKYAAMDLFGYSLRDYWIIIRFAKPNTNWSYAALVTWHLAANAACLFYGIWWVPLLWYASVTTSFMMFFRLRLWLEHQGTDWVHRLELKWWEEALFYPHLTYHHWEHHQWPAVPYCRLPELRKLVPELPTVTLAELLKGFGTLPRIPSGTPLSGGIPGRDADADTAALQSRAA